MAPGAWEGQGSCAGSVGVSPTLAGSEWSTLAWGSKPVTWGHVGLTWDAVLFMQPSTGKKKKKKVFWVHDLK